MNATGDVPRLALLAAFAVAAGCSSAPTPETQLYVLRDDQEPARRPAGSGGPALLIARVDVAAHIDGITIARDGGRIDQLVYHRWAAPVAEMAARRLQAAIEDTGAFSPVLPPETQGSADLLLQVLVRRLEIEDHPGRSPEAVVVLDGELTRRDGRSVLWAGRAGGSGAVTGTGVEGMVRALNDALGKAVRELASAAAGAKDGPPAPPLPDGH